MGAPEHAGPDLNLRMWGSMPCAVPAVLFQSTGRLCARPLLDAGHIDLDQALWVLPGGVPQPHGEEHTGSLPGRGEA